MRTHYQLARFHTLHLLADIELLANIQLSFATRLHPTVVATTAPVFFMTDRVRYSAWPIAHRTIAMDNHHCFTQRFSRNRNYLNASGRIF